MQGITRKTTATFVGGDRDDFIVTWGSQHLLDSFSLQFISKKSYEWFMNTRQLLDRLSRLPAIHRSSPAFILHCCETVRVLILSFSIVYLLRSQLGNHTVGGSQAKDDP